MGDCALYFGFFGRIRSFGHIDLGAAMHPSRPQPQPALFCRPPQAYLTHFTFRRLPLPQPWTLQPLKAVCAPGTSQQSFLSLQINDRQGLI